MAIKRQGGQDPNRGQVMTTMGYRAPRPPLCMRCGQRREGQLYTVNANGQEVCADCASPSSRDLLKGTCDPETCPCGGEQREGDDPAAA